jgi:hypothetical protein
MSKSATFLNYTAFLLLYNASFAFIYIKNTEIIGFYLLFIVNTACVLYNVSYFAGLDMLNLLPRTIMLSLIISGFLHTIAFVFIIMMLGNMKVKYANTFGTPINLPPNYKRKFDDFKMYSLITFVICFFLLSSFMTYFDVLNINFKYEVKTISNIMDNKYSLILLLLSVSPIVISCLQVSTANSFSKLTRQDLIK